MRDGCITFESGSVSRQFMALWFIFRKILKIFKWKSKLDVVVFPRGDKSIIKILE